MPLPAALRNLPLPIIGAPLFIVSNPKLVIAQCKAGVVGSMPALNARPAEQLDEWLAEISETLAAHDRAHPDRPSAPFAINQIVHKSNDRLEHDLAVCARYKVPIVITSLGARTDLNDAVHAWGGVVLHDVINNTFAKKAIEKGADGLIAGADFAYIGSAFVATEEARADDAYKAMIVASTSDDIVYSSLFTGVHGNYLKGSIRNAGLDPDSLPESDPTKMSFAGDAKKAWKDIWGCGQGIGAVKAVVPAGELVARLAREYEAARAKFASARPTLVA